MIVGTWVFSAGGHHAVDDWKVALDELGTSSGFLWVSMDGIDADELTPLADALDLHPLAVEDALSGRQRPKIDRYDSSMFVVVHPLVYDDATSSVETRELAMFVGDHYVITLRRAGGHTPLRAVRYRVDELPQALRSTPLGVLYATLDAVVDQYLAIFDALTEDFAQLESEVFDEASGVGGPQVGTSLYALKREVREFRRAVMPLLEPMASLAHSPVSPAPKQAKPFYNDVHDHLVRVSDRSYGLERQLTDVFNVHLAQVSVQQNSDARRISAVAAIIATPTLIAGVYGMNFTYMPELDLRYAYPVSLLAMVVICGLLYRGFKRSGWL